MIDPEVQWTTAAPFWDSVADLDATTRRSFRQPAILRFASDEFMNEFVAVLNNNPPQLKDFRAQPETWRGPLTTPPIETRSLPRFAQKLQRSRLAIEQKTVAKALALPEQSLALTAAATPQPVLKLYQPAHQRYYLLTAALVCRLPGQPDRHIEPGNQERATYVVRKVVPAAGQTISNSTSDTWSEYAFVSGSWQRVTNAAALLPNEEQQPLFAMNYTHDDGHRRRVLAGLIPVGKREAYVGAPERSSNNQLVLDPDLPPPPDKRTLLFMAQVTEPWKRLIERAFALDKMHKATSSVPTDDEPFTPTALAASIKTNREQIQTTAWYVLLDLAHLLKQYLPNVWNSIMGESLTSPLTSNETTLVNALINTTISAAYATNLVQNSVYSTSEVIRNLRDALQAIQGGVPFVEAQRAGHRRRSGIDRHALRSQRWREQVGMAALPVPAGRSSAVDGGAAPTGESGRDRKYRSNYEGARSHRQLRGADRHRPARADHCSDTTAVAGFSAGNEHRRADVLCDPLRVRAAQLRPAATDGS